MTRTERPAYGDRITAEHLAAFGEALPGWFDGARRPMPWRATRDPYRIWVSEIMLQQTRVDQAGPYYERFLSAFPTVEALAAADLDEVLRHWEGLGYYARARNLHRAARAVVEQHGGRVPGDASAFRVLPGVGDYTAAAVLSIAFDVPLAVLDGNVIRVLTRVFAVEDDAGSTGTRAALRDLAQSVMDRERPGRWNESVMELGATVCTPRSPACHRCPLRGVCAAAADGEPERYPVTRPKAPVPHVDVAVGVVSDAAGRYLVTRRPDEAMLGGLWEFPGGKCEPGEAHDDACRRELAEELGIQVSIGERIARIDHAYSHFRITLHAFACRIESGEPVPRDGRPMRWVEPDALSELAFPRANRRLIDLLGHRRSSPDLFG